MRLNATDFLHKAQHPLLLALASVPPALMIVLGDAPEALRSGWMLPLVYVLLAWCCILLPGRWRLVGGVVSAVLLSGVAVLSLPVAQHLLLVLLPAMYIALIFVALPIGGWSHQQELHLAWHIIGIIGHVILQLMISTERRMGTAVYVPGQKILTVSFLLCFLLSMLMFNRLSLESAAQSRRTVPLLMRRQNVILTFALLAAGVGLAALPAVVAAMEALWDFLLQCVAAVIAWLVSLLPERRIPGDSGGVSGPMEFGLGAAQQPSDLAVLLEKIFMGLAAVVLVVLLVLLARIIWKKLIRLLKILWGRLSQYSAAAGEDYVDEITSTRDEPDTERAGLLTRMRRYVPVQEEKGLSPTDRVRARYRQMKRRHADWGKASTARENLPQGPAGIYERARYGGQLLTEEEAASFQQETRRL